MTPTLSSDGSSVKTKGGFHQFTPGTNGFSGLISGAWVHGWGVTDRNASDPKAAALGRGGGFPMATYMEFPQLTFHLAHVP